MNSPLHKALYKYCSKHPIYIILEVSFLCIATLLITAKLNDARTETLLKTLEIIGLPAVILSYLIAFLIGCVAANHYKPINTINCYLALVYVIYLILNYHHLQLEPNFGSHLYIQIIFYYFIPLAYNILVSSDQKIQTIALIKKEFRDGINAFGFGSPDLPKESKTETTNFPKLAPDISIEDLKVYYNENGNNKQLREIDEDGPNFSFASDNLAKTLATYSPPFSKAFSIGIDGNWGSGKSSFISLLVEGIAKEETLRGIEYHIIKFNAWNNKDADKLIDNFFNIWKKEFWLNLKINHLLNEYSKAILDTEKTLFRTNLTNLFFGSEQDSATALLENIKEEIKKQSAKYYFIIDDLDRVNKEELLSVMRLCRVLGDFPNTIYVLAYDRVYINTLLNSEKTNGKLSSFLDKVIQLEFKVPAIDSSALIRILKQELSVQYSNVVGSNIELAKREIDKVVNKYISAIPLFLFNIRDVRRFSNTFYSRYAIVKDKTDFESFLLIELLQYKHKELFSKLDIAQWFAFYYKKKDIDIAFYRPLLSAETQSTLELETVASLLNNIVNSESRKNIRLNYNYYFLYSEPSFYLRFKEIFTNANTKTIDEIQSWMAEENSLALIALAQVEYVHRNKGDLEKEIEKDERVSILGGSEQSSAVLHSRTNNSIEIQTLIEILFILEQERIKKRKFPAEVTSNIFSALLSLHPNFLGYYNHYFSEFFTYYEAPMEKDSFVYRELALENVYSFWIGSDRRTIYSGSDLEGSMYNSINKNGPAYEGSLADSWANPDDLEGTFWISRNEKLSTWEKENTDKPFYFKRTIFFPRFHSVNITILVDDECELLINEFLVPNKVANFVEITENHKFPITKFITPGLNTFTFKVKNTGKDVYGVRFKIDCILNETIALSI